MSRAQFAEVLQQFNSPAADSAANDYTICTANKVNPAVALAFFVKISQCGTAFARGSAADHNWGNLFDPPDFAQFHHAETWEQGVRDWCVRLVANAQSGWGPAISTIVPHYFNLQPGPSPILGTISGLIKGWKETFDQQGFVIGAAPAPEVAGPRDLGTPEDTDALIEAHAHTGMKGDEDTAVPESTSRDLGGPAAVGAAPAAAADGPAHRRAGRRAPAQVAPPHHTRFPGDQRHAAHPHAQELMLTTENTENTEISVPSVFSVVNHVLTRFAEVDIIGTTTY